MCLIRQFEAQDEFVSALNIFKANDDLLGPLAPGVPDQRWSEVAADKVVREIRNNPSILDFTAQTHLSASFGLMQMLYTTAIRPVNWRGLKSGDPCFSDATDCPPTGLFDTMKNNQMGGGSVGAAAEYLRRKFADISGNSPTLRNIAEFEEKSRLVLCKYNKACPSYAEEVTSRSRSQIPVGATAVFD